MKISKTDAMYWFAVFLAVWFAFFGTVWAYWGALFVAYPAGVISLVLWKIGRRKDENKSRQKIIPIILGIGLVASLTVLAYMLVFE